MARRALKFSKMNLAELVQLRDEIETALNGRIVIERQELQSKIAELATIEGRRATNGHVTSQKTRKPGNAVGQRKTHPLKVKKAEPKYRGPKGETWAGRGLAPRWLAALERKGKKQEQFLIG